MSSHFAFGSPRIPAVPQSTPATSSNPYFLNKPRAPRPPVVNPYDKFPQAEFDDWINTITGALHRALGHETDTPDHTVVEPDSASVLFDNSPRGIHARQAHLTTSDEEQEEYETDEEGMDDSLADIRARFIARLDKGKARDPMEGPGFPISGKGDKDAPIEIDLGEDENEGDDDDVDQSLQEADVSLDSDALDDEEVAQHLSFIQPSDEDDEDDDFDQWDLPQSSVRSQRVLEEGDERREGDEEESDEESDEAGSFSSAGRQGSDNVIELLSSDDEGVAQASTSMPQIVEEEEDYFSSEGEGEEIDAIRDRVKNENLRSEHTRAPPYEIGLETALRDVEEGLEEDIGEEDAEDGFEDEEEGVEEEGEIDEEHEGDSSEDSVEDHDQPHPFTKQRNSSPEVINLDSDVEEDQLNADSDEIQPLEHDTSFPPHHDEPQIPIEIRNPWLGPQTYAEDYYAGGPVLPSQGNDVPCNPHLLGANDDREGFLTLEVVKLAESNEREGSTGEELQQPTLLHLPRLHFVHGHSAETWSEMPSETDFAASLMPTEVQNAEVEEASTRGENSSEPNIMETQHESNDVAIVDSAQEHEPPERQEELDHNVPLETRNQCILPSQETVPDGEAVCQTEAALDKIFEEIVTSEGQTEHFLFQSEGTSDVSRPLPRKIPSVTVEDVTDEETENEYLDEGEDTCISPLLPLDSNELRIEAAMDDNRPIIPSDNVPTFPDADMELVMGNGGAKDSLPTVSGVLVEITNNGDSETLSNVVDVAISDTVESHISTTEVLEQIQPSNQLLPFSASLPATDFVDTALESDLEHQQLPTPPAEQEVLSHCAPMKHGSPETQPETLVEEDETTIVFMTKGEKLSQQDSKATLVRQSPVTTTITLEKEIPAVDHEQKSTNAPTNIAVAAEENVSQTVGFDENILGQQFVGQTESMSPNTGVSPSVAVFVSDVAIQDITEGAIAIEVDDCLAIVEEIPSKAASEEPGFFDEPTAAGTFSKESSVISLSFSDGAGVSSGLSYLVEELLDDGVTDEDADGEVDPDLGIASMQNITSSRRWNDLADEIFDARLWDLGEPLSPPVESVKAGTDQSTIIPKEDPLVHIAKQSEPVAVPEEDQPDSQITLTDENPTKPTIPDSSGDPAVVEDDIASSRETSPSPVSVEHPTRSPSLDTLALHTVERLQTSATLLPQNSPSSGSEKALYGDKDGIAETETHDIGMADETKSFTKEMTPDVGADDTSTTIPGLTLTTSLRPTSPIPGLGARLLEDSGVEAADGEIPGLTWSKTFPSPMTKECSIPPRSLSYPQINRSPSHSPISLNQAHEWLMTHVPYTITRRATEPVLFSDPYPYSLSTPGLDGAKDEAGDTEDEEQDMSMSSSSTSLSVEKDSERDVGEPGLETEGNNDGRSNFTASAGENKPEEAKPEPSQDLIGPVETIDGYLTFTDADADGDLDPDFVVLHDSITGPNEEPTVHPEVPVEASYDVAAPGAVSSDTREGTLNVLSETMTKRPSEPQQSSPEILQNAAPEVDLGIASETVVPALTPESVEPETNGTQMDNNRSKSLELTTIEEFPPTTTRQKEVVKNLSTRPSPRPLSPPPQVDESDDSKKRTSNGKRKRSLTPQPKIAAQDAISDQPNNGKKSKSAQRTKSQSSQHHHIKRRRTASSTNGKPVHSDSDDSVLSSVLTAPSDADDDVSFVADDLLRGDHEESSQTPMVELSPAAENTAEHFYPMLHRHGRGAKNQSKNEQVLPSQRPVQKPSGSRSSDKTHSQEPPHVPFASRRATRSNCRYRKISVPREEDGPRVCFLVPGCSLGDEEVIEENEIEDLGEATYADSLRMVRDIGSLFDSYLIGVLRQLVGVDLLREQEVFYLPAPGEEPIVRKPMPKKTASDKSGLSKRPSKSGNVDTSSVVSTPSRSVASTFLGSPSFSRAPASHSSVTSTSVSAARRGSRYERDSLTPTSSLSLSSSDEEKESDDNEQKPSKPWSKHSHGVEREKHSGHLTKGGKIPKRGRRLTSDALAYKPHSDSEGDSSPDDNATRFVRRKSMTSKGLKRTRSGKSFAVSEEADGRDAKKIKRDR